MTGPAQPGDADPDVGAGDTGDADDADTKDVADAADAADTARHHRRYDIDAADDTAVGLPAEREPTDWIALAMGPLALVFSLLTFYTGTASTRGISVSQTWNAWHGVFGWFGALVAFGASVLVALELFAPGQVALRWPTWRAVGVLFALAVVAYLIAWFVTPITAAGTGYTVHFGRGIGFYGGLVFAVIGLVVAVLRLRPSATGTR